MVPTTRDLEGTTSLPDILQKDLFAFCEAFAKATGASAEDIQKSLTLAPSPEMGDYALPCFVAAKAAKKSPVVLAQELAGALRPSGSIDRIVATGPYVNIFFDRQKIAEKVLTLTVKKDYGGTKTTSAKVMIEYVSPNTNKPLHLGHIRNGLIGWSVAELLKTQGNKTLKSQIINDRGIHIIKSMLAYQKWGEGATPESAGMKGDHFVGKWYVRFEQEYQKERATWLTTHPDKKDDAVVPTPLMEEARAMLLTWEKGEKGVRALWKTMNAWVYEGFAKTFSALGLDFNKEDHESEVYTGGKEIIEDALKKGVFKKMENGAIVAPLENIGLPDKVVLRADGTGLYVTQDLSLAIQRFQKHKLHQLVYCVGSEQDLYFRQLFAILKLLDSPIADKVTHLSYGLVFLPEGKMKSREGKVVDADDLVATVIDLANAELTKRYPDLSKTERAKRSRAIGLAALKFQFLLVGNQSPIHFDPKAAIAFEGRTGPYLQYSYARAASILRKVGKIKPGKVQQISDEEWALVTHLLRYPSILREAAHRLDPSHLATSLLDLAQSFHSFYHSSPVLNAPEGVRETRLALVKAFSAVMKNGLALLGIETLEEM